MSKATCCHLAVALKFVFRVLCLTCRKLEAMWTGSEPVSWFLLNLALAKKGITAKADMSPVS